MTLHLAAGSALKSSPVYNRGQAPIAFLADLIEFGRRAPAEIFAPNGRFDIYSSVVAQLGPWQSPLHRRAAMLEVLRVLAGFESSWKWNTGRDVTNPNEKEPETISAGPFQVSANSIHFGRDLRELVMREVWTLDSKAFQAAMKTKRQFAIEYAARLLRYTVRHHGPVRDGYIHKWLRRAAVAEFQAFLA